MPSQTRLESNTWLRAICATIQGDILSIGSGADNDGEGSKYRNYFSAARSYKTSEISAGCDLVLDVTNMHSISNESFDGIFCSGVLEHVFDFRKALDEMHRVLRPKGILLLGLPFNQPIHAAPNDFWRFTKSAIHGILNDNWIIKELQEICNQDPTRPVAYWTRADKK